MNLPMDPLVVVEGFNEVLPSDMYPTEEGSFKLAVSVMLPTSLYRKVLLALPGTLAPKPPSTTEPPILLMQVPDGELQENVPVAAAPRSDMLLAGVKLTVAGVDSFPKFGVMAGVDAPLYAVTVTLNGAPAFMKAVPVALTAPG
jgi:hypothetical protein